MRVTALACLIVVFAPLAPVGAEELKYTGKVLDASSKSVSGANVTLYLFPAISTFPKCRKVAETATDGQGRFALTVPAERADDEVGTILVAKDGCALCWRTVLLEAGKDFTLKLAAPSTFGGVIVDDQGKPVADAEIKACLVRTDEEGPQSIFGGGDLESLRTRTDSTGAFSFANIPPDAVGDFLVCAPGRAPLYTMNEGDMQIPFKYAAGRKDMEITLQPEAVIEGRVVDKDTSNGIGGITVTAVCQDNLYAGEGVGATSAPDGSFRLGGLGEGEYTVSAVAQPGKGDLIVSDVTVTTAVGETSLGVKIEVERVSLIEVKFIDGLTGRTVASAGVRVASTDGNWTKTVTTRSTDLRVRVAPGDYQIVEMRAHGYKSLQIDDVIRVTSGETKAVSYTLEPEAKLAGVVLDENGAPLEGATVILSAGAAGRKVKTDRRGSFEVPSSALGPAGGTTPMIIARHEGKNLAAVLELTDTTKTLEVRLKPAWVIKGKVVTPEGRPIAAANVSLGLGAVRPAVPYLAVTGTDADGRYEIPAVPPASGYDVNARMNGYGTDEATFDLGETAGDTYAVRDMVLLAADESLSGTVVDTGGKPIERLLVEVRGKGQRPNATAVTDSEGKFTLTDLVRGEVAVSARGGSLGYFGTIETQAGAQDVKLVVRPSGSVEPESLVGKALPDLNAFGAGAAWTAAVDEAKEKVILVVWHDPTQRPSRHAVSALAEKQAALLEKNVAVFVVDVSGQKPDDAAPGKPDSVFPTAWVTEKVEDTRTAWGVKALPWLVLADKRHIIRAEGFAVDELDVKMAEVLGQ